MKPETFYLAFFSFHQAAALYVLFEDLEDDPEWVGRVSERWDAFIMDDIEDGVTTQSEEIDGDHEKTEIIYTLTVEHTPQ